MMISRLKLFASAALVVMCCTILSAQTIEPTNANMSAQEKANLKLVLDWWREVLQAHHVELIDKYADPNMIQHNPNFPNGTAALKANFGRQTPVNPIPATLATLPKMAFSQGDLVMLVWDHEEKDPTDALKTYHYDSFDAFRIKNGKIVEHWDAAKKNPPAPARGAAPAGARQ